jgi:hypothetical protein
VLEPAIIGTSREPQGERKSFVQRVKDWLRAA